MAEVYYKVKTLNRYSAKTSDKPADRPPEGKPFQTFEDLEVYQLARGFRKAIYGVARRLPDFEKFGLVSQMRRAAASLTNNISEGHGRYRYPDQIKFLLPARGSLEELQDDLNICLDENYLPAAEIKLLKQQGWRVLNVLNGYAVTCGKRKLRARIQPCVTRHRNRLGLRKKRCSLQMCRCNFLTL